MTENNYDWSKFILRVNINNNAQSIYDAWASKAQLENWFLRRAEIADKNGIQKAGHDKINEGDNYLWYWHGYSDADTEKGIFTKANGKDEIAFTFGIAGTVKVNIRDEGSYRMVELTQEDIPITEKARIDYHL
ncbi:MAG: SRPBCC domain-containing protein, partial [Chitinophagaceae bacterium]